MIPQHAQRKFKTLKEGLKNFGQIRVSINEIEWLFLASQGHRRALFEVIKNGSKFSIEGKWLIP